MVQRPDNERESASKTRTHKRVCCNRGRGILCESVDEIVERTLEDGEEPGGEKRETNARNNPGDGWRCCPSDYELPTAEEDGPDHHWWETFLGYGTVARSVVRPVVEVLVDHVDACTKDAAQQDGDERKFSGQNLPAANFAKDNGDGSELHVQDAIAEAGVESHAEADGSAENLDRTDQKFSRQLDDADIPFFELGVESPVAGLMAETAGLVDKELGWVRFVDEDYVD